MFYSITYYRSLLDTFGLFFALEIMGFIDIFVSIILPDFVTNFSRLILVADFVVAEFLVFFYSGFGIKFCLIENYFDGNRLNY